LPTAPRRGASCWASSARRMRGGPGCTAGHAPLPQRGPLTGWRIASVLLRAQVEAGAHAKDWLASPGEDEPHWSLIDTADLASRAPASSMCAPAPRADRPACTGAPPWVPLGPLCGLWPAEPASPSASTGEVSLAVDWAALARRTITMTEATAVCGAPLLPVRSARRTRTRAACAVPAHLRHCIQDHIGYCGLYVGFEIG